MVDRAGTVSIAVLRELLCSAGSGYAGDGCGRGRVGNRAVPVWSELSEPGRRDNRIAIGKRDDERRQSKGEPEFDPARRAATGSASSSNQYDDWAQPLPVTGQRDG